jgi:hypothetical protein
MKTLWIAASLGLVSSVALAQSANKTATSLDTCFKLVRVTEANCPASANDAERQECLQNARKMQRVCLELAGQQPAAAVDRPPAAAEAVSADKPVETVSPTLPANPPDKPAEPEKAVAATPTPPVIPTPPVTVTGSIFVPPTAQASGAKTSGWTVSETSSPVDYSPLVTATILARSASGNTSTALVVRCRARRSELALRMDSVPRGSRGDEFPAAYQINDQPAVKSRWTASADGKTANYKGDATALLQSLSEDARLKIVVSDGSGRDSEAAFQLAGWSAIRDKIATACMWTSAASKSSERR